MESIIPLIPEEKRHLLGKMKQWQDDMFKGLFGLSSLDGKNLFPGFLSETAKFVRDYWESVRENDIFVASYPKTGSNWMMEIISKLIILKHPNHENLIRHLPLPFQSLEVGPVFKFDLLDVIPTPRRVFLSHLDTDILPVEKFTKKGAKIIQVVRNPMDQTVAWYHFSRKVLGKNPRVQHLFPDDWEKFIKIYFAGKHPTFDADGDWYPEFLQSWCKHEDNPNVEFIYYEDMIKNLPGEIIKMADFLNIEISQEQADMIASESTFEAMSKRYQTDDNLSSMDQVRKKVMRKGVIGDWKNYFSEEQAKAIVKEFDSKLSGTKIKFTYE